MDRRTALERLDAARPGSDDLRRPELADVQDMIERDPAFAAEWEHRQAWDRRLGQALDDVPVPAGLKGRLLAAVAQAADAEDVRTSMSVAAPPLPRRYLSRRAWLAGVAASAAGVAAAVFFAVPTGPDISVAEIRDAAAGVLKHPSETPAFDGSFEPRLPPAWALRLRVSDRAFGVLPTASGKHGGAAFGFVAGGSRPMRGILVIVPAASVVSSPTAHSPHTPDYAAPVNGSPSIAWTADGYVYVCAVEGNVSDLLRRLEGVTV